MHVILAGLFFFAILTLWVPGYWPVTIFQVGIFTLAAVAVWRARVSPPAFAWPLVPLSFAVLLGLAQVLTGNTAYAFETKLATVRWATFLSVFIIGITLFRNVAVRRWFRLAVTWFAFAVAVLATVQAITSGGKVFWLFNAPNAAYVMGPILSRNHYAAFIEAVLPIAVYSAVRGGRESLLYSGMAAAMYASVIASTSRAGIVLATAEVIIVPLLMWARRLSTGHDATVAAGRIGAMLAVFTAMVGWSSAWVRLWTPDPFIMRHELAISTLHMSLSHLWLGTGLGTWPVVYPQYAVIDVGAFANQAHNDWLQWTAEGGVPFGIMLASMFVWCLRPAFRSVWGLGVVAVFLHAAVDYPFSRPALGSWPILILSMVAAAAQSQHSGSSSPRGATPCRPEPVRRARCPLFDKASA